MQDNALIALLISTVQTGLTAQAITVGIQQREQPTQQGAPTAPCILLCKIGDNRYGFPGRSDVYQSAGVTAHTETQEIETTFQVNALATQNPADITQLTAADYLKAVGRVLQSEATIVTLRASGVGIYRIQKQNQTFFKDDRDQFNADPSFDFTVTHKDAFTAEIPSTALLVPTIAAVN